MGGGEIYIFVTPGCDESIWKIKFQGKILINIKIVCFKLFKYDKIFKIGYMMEYFKNIYEMNR